MKYATALLLTISASCFAGPAGPDGRTVAAFATSARAAAARSLKDPGSAQFRNLFVSMAESKDSDDPDPSSLWLCGELNAKNGFGGYVGFRRFATNGGGKPIFEDPGTEDGFREIVWQSKCSYKVKGTK